MLKVKVGPKGLICPSNGLPKWPFDVGMIIQAWTCTCMQGNTKRINANHWMEVNTNGGMDEFVTWIKRPTFRMKKRPTTLGEQHHTVHHTMAVDPTPGDKIPGRPASLFGRSDQVKLEVVSTDVARRNMGRSIEGWWIKRPVGMTFPPHVLNFAWKLPQPTYLRKVHALASAPPWKSYKRTPTPHFQSTENWSKSKA